MLLDASLGGATGNTGQLLAAVQRRLARRARVTLLRLAEQPAWPTVVAAITAADGLVIGTGTHWDSWSSHLQRFLEEATPHEGTALWLGKPVAVVVSEHSVGGKGVLSRLQGVLVTLGGTLPPMSGLVVSLAAQLAQHHAPAKAVRDLWSPEDLSVVCHNLLEAIHGTRAWRTWPVDRRDFSARWIEP